MKETHQSLWVVIAGPAELPSFLDIPIAEQQKRADQQQQEIINGRTNKEQAELCF